MVHFPLLCWFTGIDVALHPRKNKTSEGLVKNRDPCQKSEWFDILASDIIGMSNFPSSHKTPNEDAKWAAPTSYK